MEAKQKMIITISGKNLEVIKQFTDLAEKLGVAFTIQSETEIPKEQILDVRKRVQEYNQNHEIAIDFDSALNDIDSNL